ncbi:hypothetical protein PQZ50_03505 [Methylophilaceae bacterium]|nr:hypothetical protein [Methylophilaceae bacterium]
MKGLFLLSLIIPIMSHGKEVFTNDQGLKIEYVKPSVSCLYDKEAYEGYLNTCLMLPNYETCAQLKYENYICSDQNMIKQLEKKAKEAG